MARIKKEAPPDRKPTFLRQWREYRGMTLEEAAEKFEMHHTSLMRVEKGAVPYSQDFLERAATVYGCEATDFLDNDPRAWNLPRLVYDRLRQAPPDKQREAMAIIDALLKAS